MVTTRLNNPGVTTSGVGYQFQRDIMGRGEGEGGGGGGRGRGEGRDWQRH